MARTTARGQRHRVALAWTLLGLIGCARGGSLLPAVEPDQARQTLRRALDAWQAGQPDDALTHSSPQVRVIDEDWHAGLKLESFEVNPQDRTLGPTLRCPVTLRLRDRAGRPVRKVVAFDVATGSSPSVIRQD